MGLCIRIAFRCIIFIIIGIADQPGGNNALILIPGHIEQAHTLRLATGDSDRIPLTAMHTNADHLPVIGDQHQLVFLNHGKACHDTAITITRFDIGNALPAASGATVI